MPNATTVSGLQDTNRECARPDATRRTAVNMDPRPVLVRQRPHPPPLVNSVERKAPSVDIPRADGNDARHPRPPELPLHGVNIEPPRLVLAASELLDAAAPDAHHARGLGEGAVARAREDLDLRDARLEARGQQAQLAHAAPAAEPLRQDGLPAAGQAEDVAPRRARGKRPALPLGTADTQAQQPGQHLQRRVLDRGGDVLRRQMHLDVLVHARDDVVGPLGDGEDAAGDEAVVAARRGLAGERGHDVAEDVGDDVRVGEARVPA